MLLFKVYSVFIALLTYFPNHSLFNKQVDYLVFN